MYMKKIFLILILASFCVMGSRASEISITPVVDERAELMSIVFRLAEAHEYVTDDLKQYTDDIDNYFKPYKKHPIISFVQKERKKRGIGYDAVMSMAINLQIKDGTISLNKNLTEASLDSRWDRSKDENFITLLNDFYQKSNFRLFFDQQKNVRDEAEKNFSSLLGTIKFEWFEKFYGSKPTGQFHIILSLSNGPNNYGPSITSIDGREDIYAIMGCWATDSLGNPAYSPRVISIIIHEFNHSFCNPLIRENLALLLPKGKEFFKLVETKMQRQAYGEPETMLFEILVRACECKYLEYAGTQKAYITRGLKAQKGMGFLWIEELFNALGVYEQNREQYSTLRDFMPEVIALQNSLDPKAIQEELEKNQPNMSVLNIENGSKNVDPNTEFIIVKFDRPMSTGNNGSSYGKKGKSHFPTYSNEIEDYWSEDGTMWYFPVKLKPNTTYSLSFPAQFFMTTEYARPKNTIYLDFKTAKKAK